MFAGCERRSGDKISGLLVEYSCQALRQVHHNYFFSIIYDHRCVIWEFYLLGLHKASALAVTCLPSMCDLKYRLEVFFIFLFFLWQVELLVVLYTRAGCAGIESSYWLWSNGCRIV